MWNAFSGRVLCVKARLKVDPPTVEGQVNLSPSSHTSNRCAVQATSLSC